MGAVSLYFSHVSRPGFDVTLLTEDRRAPRILQASGVPLLLTPCAVLDPSWTDIEAAESTEGKCGIRPRMQRRQRGSMKREAHKS